METALLAQSDYIAYFNELVGGPANWPELSGGRIPTSTGARVANSLKQWTEQNHLTHIYLDYFGTGAAIEYLPDSKRTCIKPPGGP